MNGERIKYKLNYYKIYYFRFNDFLELSSSEDDEEF